MSAVHDIVAGGVVRVDVTGVVVHDVITGGVVGIGGFIVHDVVAGGIVRIGGFCGFSCIGAVRSAAKDATDPVEEAVDKFLQFCQEALAFVCLQIIAGLADEAGNAVSDGIPVDVEIGKLLDEVKKLLILFVGEGDAERRARGRAGSVLLLHSVVRFRRSPA